VTVALQLPESEAQDAPNGRLLDKFPSTTTLWFVLRKFEAGVAGNGSTRNLTARAVPVTDSETNGTGNLYYQTPVLQVMGRELVDFSDLQKSLAQLGFNRGNVLFRLSFRTTQQRFDDAVMMISQYFKDSGEENGSSSAIAGVAAVSSVPAQIPEPATTTEQDITQNVAAPEASTIPSSTPLSAPEAEGLAAEAQPTEAVPTLSVSERPVTVYKPPSNATPYSALESYNEQDYVPSIEHAKSHQERLNQLSHNIRLPSDKEIADKAAAEQERLAGITETEVKIRFPDQSQVVAKFKQADTGSSLYSFVQGCLHASFVNEKFSLVIFGATAKQPRAGPGGPRLAIPDSDQEYLIKDLGLRGRVLVNFTWADSSPASATTTAILKPELRTQAQDIKIPSVPGIVEEEAADKKQSALGKLGMGLKKEEGGSGRKGGGVPKWLKLPGKK
jgi:tether containing UBX domain for GLUT4